MQKRMWIILLFLIYSHTSFALRKGEQALLRLPQSLTSVISQNVQEMFDKAYFQEMGPHDFFHGHLIPTHWELKSYSLAEAIADSPKVLYHTAEYNQRWSKETKAGIPTELHTPRSLVGLESGQVETAINLIGFSNFNISRQKAYAQSGTIYDKDLITHRPDLMNSEINLIDQHQLKYITLKFLNGSYDVYIKNQFYILPDKKGPYVLANNVHYDIFLAVTNQNEPIGYADANGYGPIIIPEDIFFPWPEK